MNKTLINGENKKLKHLTVEWPKGILKVVKFPESSGNRQRWKRIPIQMSVRVSQNGASHISGGAILESAFGILYNHHALSYDLARLPQQHGKCETQRQTRHSKSGLLSYCRSQSRHSCSYNVALLLASQVSLLLVVITPITGLLVQFNDTIWCSLTT